MRTSYFKVLKLYSEKVLRTGGNEPGFTAKIFLHYGGSIKRIGLTIRLSTLITRVIELLWAQPIRLSPVKEDRNLLKKYRFYTGCGI